jgi:hypothetical protein
LDIRVVETNALLSWSAAWPGFELQQNTDITTTNWVSATNPVTTVNGNNEVNVGPIADTTFFRLVLSQ